MQKKKKKNQLPHKELPLYTTLPGTQVLIGLNGLQETQGLLTLLFWKMCLNDMLSIYAYIYTRF